MKAIKKFSIDALRFTAPILLVGGVFYIIYSKFDISIDKIDDNDFEFQFIGILLGFALTIFQFIVSLVDKVREKKEIEYQSAPEKLILLKSRIDALYKEIKENITFIFISLLIISALYLVQSEDPIVNLIFKSLRSAVFFLNLYAVYDLIIVSFKVSDTTSILKIEDKS